MELRDVVSTAVSCRPETTLAEAARQMDDEGVGSVVVVDGIGNVVGIVTDRDITVRGMAADRPPTTPVKQVMTSDVVLVREDSDLFEAARQMAAAECRRLPVVGSDGALVGVVTLDDLMLLFAHQTDSLASVIAAETAIH
ncbi:MAG: CBS domain-containing protein [Mycobacteriales bacterium]